MFIIENKTGIKCCTPDGKPLEPKKLHHECYPIDIPFDDAFFSKFDRTCMSFTRSSAASRLDCSIGHREQVN